MSTVLQSLQLREKVQKEEKARNTWISKNKQYGSTLQMATYASNPFTDDIYNVKADSVVVESAAAAQVVDASLGHYPVGGGGPGGTVRQPKKRTITRRY